MRAWQSQRHVRWSCRYHLVIGPTYRQQAICDTLRKDIGRAATLWPIRPRVDRRAGHVRPCARMLAHTTEVERGAGSGTLQGRQRCAAPSLWSDPPFYGRHVWPRVLRRRGVEEAPSRIPAGISAPRATSRAVVLEARPHTGERRRGRSSRPQSPFRALLSHRPLGTILPQQLPEASSCARALC